MSFTFRLVSGYQLPFSICSYSFLPVFFTISRIIVSWFIKDCDYCFTKFSVCINYILLSTGFSLYHLTSKFKLHQPCIFHYIWIKHGLDLSSFQVTSLQKFSHFILHSVNLCALESVVCLFVGNKYKLYFIMYHVSTLLLEKN